MVYGDPKYPVINPAPGFYECMGALRPTEYVTLGAMTFGSSAFGFITGKPVRPQSASVAGLIGFMGGFCYIYQNSYGRLMGMSKND
mmetsp:Transcript_12103/g.15956  ORF Transcript_12103/g.15956 Transcript_12103/m.15956 type:complete len:86 (+) Transcript_12103:43-300(+)|eukprot:CAMPEP_0185757562 /NCGR_PEP_ID=MMETSP1174-20130828/16033_1 /TAXON_ID=35687 /ORGANISM="Dictyocha speculum, Strain CCMP1381" /LENGTH=85 /DNA_ID=CAMNT_0028437001 /DNA_START=41 /DNA_END=298 /DNA_ORIENTATION=-